MRSFYMVLFLVLFQNPCVYTWPVNPTLVCAYLQFQHRPEIQVYRYEPEVKLKV